MNRYKDISRTVTNEGRRYIVNAIYPEIPVSEDDLYVITTGTDRYDTLAIQFYNDATLWWIIAAANPSTTSLFIPPLGTQLRIPASKDQVLNLFNRINNTR